ncbi:MAG: PQQ-dependent dehydrogenase, methanol/ethanol family [Gammaproteobacteria bacterium]|nr:PQQ-dependent dehydrogenase, methanol/ethanol family [Gammaproteobacteria bacterium]MBT5205420.1 PQQ-dependent dehydrogenase, methanol/ethanol family [Gammaproteobacteria bacterium]MBT5601298.1 PQQ-dependent dehydrogenase, methanol/ethanol family [Gammaproteobacteria bacterium]MBT6244973.1 PQQ-dependent dehydrogenase, methanol/ethanol family [Gammaproteobacteria bacterium]
MAHVKKRGETLNRTSLIVGLIAISALLYFSSSQDESAQAPVAPQDTDIPEVSIGLIDDERIISAESEPGNWLAHGRTYEEQRFSPLTQINKSNVSDLGLAWYKDMGTNRALESTPIVVDDVMFFTTSWSRVYAVSAVNGEEIWFYDPQVPREWGRRACCDVVNRGVAVYKGKVYVASLDGRLIALDAGTGEEVWEVDTITDRSRFYTITGAPRVANGKVFIGNGGAEFGVRGYVTAYDAENGDEIWRFFTVPGDPALPFENPQMEMAAKTWKGGEWWKVGGGGTVWNSIVYDPDFNQLYLGVGNGSPWTRVIRSPGGGDNLFLSSIVALDADTGVYKWHYQTTPGDNWDYTAVQDMALADMEVDGVARKVLLQAPKNGFFYVLDRSDGELLRANPFATVTWATGVDLATGRPVENPDLDYTENAKWVLPGPLGAHNWQAMSVDVAAGLVYLPAQDNPLIFDMVETWKETGIYKRNPGGWNTGIEFGRITQTLLENIAEQPTPKGYLKAFDPLTGEDRWVIEIPHYWNGGVLGTQGGLVFHGDALGMFTAYDKENGEILWQYNTYTSMLAPPITFESQGVQYVSILTGTGGGDLFGGEPLPPVSEHASLTYNNSGRMLVFKLGGQVELAAPNRRDRSIPEQEVAELDDAVIARGELHYNEYCAVCHGIVVRSGGAIADLRRMNDATHQVFNEIVIDGIYGSKGMAGFSDVLTAPQAADIHQFVRARAHEDREVSLGNKKPELAQLTWQ